LLLGGKTPLDRDPSERGFAPTHRYEPKAAKAEQHHHPIRSFRNRLHLGDRGSADAERAHSRRVVGQKAIRIALSVDVEADDITLVVDPIQSSSAGDFELLEIETSPALVDEAFRQALHGIEAGDDPLAIDRAVVVLVADGTLMSGENDNVLRLKV
jgi:hypothetical protein